MKALSHKTQQDWPYDEDHMAWVLTLDPDQMTNDSKMLIIAETIYTFSQDSLEGEEYWWDIIDRTRDAIWDDGTMEMIY